MRTGDLAREDEDGRYHIVGRIKEMIIRDGENVYPAEVEDALRSLAGVCDAAVFGIPSETWGEEVAAALVCQPGAQLDVDSLAAALAGKLALQAPPAGPLRRRPAADRVGKVQKFRLIERFGRS